MIYAYAQITVTNPDAFSAYREKAADALAKHGGAVAGASMEPTVIDGTPNVPNVAVVLTFPDRDAALSWINDETLSDLHDLRRSAGASDILLLA